MTKYKFKDIFLDDSKNISKINSDEITNIGNIAVIDQSRKHIAGYVEESNYKVCKNERIIFGDHTRIIKYINIPFIAGADGVKTLKLKDEKNCLYKFFYYYLQYINIPNNGYSRHFKFLKEKEFIIPPIKFQKKVVEALEKIEELIENKEKQMRKFDELVKSQFVEMFENEKNEEILNNVCKFINGDRGKNYPSAGEFVESGIPFINAGLIKEKKVNWEEMNYITEEKYNKLGSGKIQKDDVLYCLRGSLGKHCIIDIERKGAIASSLVILRANKEKILPEYLLNILDTDEIIMQQEQANNGSSQPNLSAGSVKKYKIKLPNIKRQEEFVNIVKQINKQKEICNKIIDKLNELKNSKMQEYFGGVINE